VSTCVVSGDAERLRQMLSNLVSNALKFTPSGGSVTVGLARNDARVVLTVSDTGQGIVPAFLPYVFDMFRRADDSPASSRRGLGLGLSIVRHIAELHGGGVTVESAGRNRGATFTVTLPAGWQPVGVMAWGSAHMDGLRAPLTLDTQRILIVDDDPTTRESLTAALTTFGAAVAIASTGREALAVAADLRPTVVLSDLAMPDGDGFWLLDALRHGGANGAEFIKAIDAGTLPQVAFYKPQGNLNEHPGYTDVTSGDQHIADVIAHLQASPQWKNMVVVVTYDENGGFWDHATPPTADRWGPGTRIPALIVSPYAKKGFVDHTQYDTGSILRFITRRFSLPRLAGLQQRDDALKANGGQPMGDLTNALQLSPNL